MSALDNIIKQRISALYIYADKPEALDEKLDELKYFVRRKLER